MPSRSRNRAGEPSTTSQANRSSSGRAIAQVLRTSHDARESPNLDGAVREREATREALEALRRDFRDSFGRDPSPDDPVFFDPSAEEPQSVDEYGEALFTRMSEMAMRRAGIDPSMIYAWHKTGLIVTERNQHLLSADDWEDWIEAIFEYEGEAICLHLQEAHGRGPEAAAKEAGSIFADHGDRICPYCGQYLDEPHDPTVVELGDAVTAREDGSNELERSTVVGKLEARLDLTWISVKSPLGLGAAGQQTGSDRRRRDAGWADAVRGAEDRARQPIRISIPVSAHDDAEPLVLGQVVEENSPNLAYSPSLRRSASFSLCPARLSSDDWVMPFVEDRFGSNPFTGVSPSVCVVIRLANRNP